jgi:hypothetical protein
MSRVVLVLVLAVVAFALMVNLAPDVVERLVFQVTGSSADSANTAADDAAKSPKPAVRKKPAAKQSLPVATEPMTNAPLAASINQPVSGGRMQSVFSVSAEDAALYSANAPGGAVISHLRKGEVVEPQYTLNSAGQEWTFVNVTDQKVSGFLRSDNLGRNQVAAEPTSR